MSGELVGRVALVTGATRGIGAAIAQALAGAGATVIGTATSAAGAAAISGRLQPAGGHGIVLDVTDAAACESALDSIHRQHGALGILVNNAGVTRDDLLMRMSDAEWAAVIETNLTSVFRLCRLSIRPMMKARGGRIINVGSVVGAIGNAGQANYAAAKAGLVGFSKSLAREVASRGITVNCVAPGFIETDMTRDLPEAQRAALLGMIPMARYGTAAEVAGAVLYLASPAAAYVTGSTLHVNGGLHMP